MRIWKMEGGGLQIGERIYLLRMWIIQVEVGAVVDIYKVEEGGDHRKLMDLEMNWREGGLKWNLWQRGWVGGN